MIIGYYSADSTIWHEVFNDRNPQAYNPKDMILYKDSIYIRTGVQYMDNGVHRDGYVEVPIDWIEATTIICVMQKVYGDKYFAM